MIGKNMQKAGRITKCNSNIIKVGYESDARSRERIVLLLFYAMTGSTDYFIKRDVERYVNGHGKGDVLE